MPGRLWRLLTVPLLALVLAVGLATSAEAHPRGERALARLTTDFWATLLSTPGAFDDPSSPFVVPVCLSFDHVVAPFDGSGATEFSCTVRFGTPVLVAGWTLEASAYEELTTPGLPGPRDPSPAGLRRRAVSQLPAEPTVLLDGAPLPLTRVVGRPTTVRLPQPNLLASPDRSTTFVATAWVTTVTPCPGRHVVTITPAPTADQPDAATVTTHLDVVRRGRGG